MSRIAENIKRIVVELGKIQLIVVSKYRSIAEIQEAYDAGHRVFAENRVQALLERKESLPADIQWHLIGHLQTNKVKFIAPFVRMIHSVDSLKLLVEIDKQAEKNNRVIDCLLQVHIAQEETKFGFSPEELMAFLKEGNWQQFKNVRICGLMAMASLTESTGQITQEFELVRALFAEAKQSYFSSAPEFKELSIGMSSDYAIAAQHGSTMVRIGSAVFE